MSRGSRRQSGQAAVESALTLPLTVFLVLGTMQLFLMMQARLIAQYATMRATRAGSLNSGDCTVMLHSAIAALLPAFDRTDSPTELLAAWDAHKFGKFAPGFGPHRDGARTESIVWIDRQHPRPAEIPNNEEEVFDLANNFKNLEVRLIFWYPLKIPFANWVITKMALTSWGLTTFNSADPLMLRKAAANWNGSGPPPSLDVVTANEVLVRDNAQHYVLPIITTYSMRMMTPARKNNFAARFCPPFP